MPQNKLDYFLDRLNDGQKKSFSSFLKSSVKKKDQILSELLSLINKGITSNENQYRRLYSEKPFSQKQIKNLRSQLFSKLNEFLVSEEFTKSNETPLFLARSFNRIGATRYFEKCAEEGLDHYESDKLSLGNQRVHLDLKSEILTFNYGVNGRKALGLSALMQETEEFFAARILYLSLAYIASQEIAAEGNRKSPFLLWPDMLQMLEAGAWSESVLIQVYFGLYKLATEPSGPGNFEKVKFLLTLHAGKFEPLEAQQLYNPALNHCIKAWNDGEEGMMDEIFHLYLEMLEKGLLIFEGKMSAWHFKIVVGAAILLSKYEWAEDFIAANLGSIPLHFRENMENYCCGMLAFQKGDFEQAEIRMNRVLESYQDPFFGFDTRSYLLRIHYESGNLLSMESLCNSFRLFLRRNKQLPSRRLQNYKEFIRFFRRFISIGPKEIKKAKKLRLEIIDSPFRANRRWLLEKLAGIIGE